jgi:hypothetical protein
VTLSEGAGLRGFMPNPSRPVRLPLSRRLTGQVANGDLARANFFGDDSASRVTEEEVDVQQRAQRELTTARQVATCQRVILATRRPVAGECYPVSGRLMKAVPHGELEDLGGVLRAARLVLVDSLREGEQSAA